MCHILKEKLGIQENKLWYQTDTSRIQNLYSKYEFVLPFHKVWKEVETATLWGKGSCGVNGSLKLVFFMRWDVCVIQIW